MTFASLLSATLETSQNCVYEKMDYQPPHNVPQGIPYNIPGISVEEAAMAATAAASGQGYPPYIPSECLRRASQRISGGNNGVAIKKERGSSSPQPIGFLMTQAQQLQHPQSVFVNN
jgi:nuclear transcription factor Y alpha